MSGTGARGIGFSTLVLGALAAAFGWFSANRGAVKLPSPDGIVRTEHLVSSQTVLTAVRDLARLESVSFHMERVIDLEERQARMFGLVPTKDQILLVAAGDVLAGIDLAKLHDGDIVVQDVTGPPPTHSVQLHLPPPEILSVTLDSKRTYVHLRKTGWFAKPAADLEARARLHAEEAIRTGALESGILERARKNAGTTLSTLVRSLGYEHVELSWRE